MLFKAFYSILLKKTFQIVIVCIGVSTPSIAPLPLSCEAPSPLNLQTAQALFINYPLSMLVFREPSLKVEFFSKS